jgi:hypothetical protein
LMTYWIVISRLKAAAKSIRAVSFETLNDAGANPRSFSVLF